MIPEIGKENQFMKNYLSLEKKLSRLYWRKNPYWFLPFKKFDDEEFKEINRYYGFYFISNYGQVVSFHRRFPQVLRYQFSNGSFVVELYIQGVPTKHYIHDLVYAHFCKPFDSDYSVVHRNGISTDNYYKNLRLKVRRNVPIHKRRRKKRHDFSLFFRIESEAPPSSALSVSIIQFDKGGKFLREYPSIKMASVGSGVSTSNIILCCIGRKRFSGGYQWKYKRDPLFKKGICNIEPVKKLTYYNAIAVLQFDYKGKFIKEYSSIARAAWEHKTCRQSIQKCAQGKKRAAGGFQWRYRNDPVFANGIIDMEPLIHPELRELNPVLQFDLEGKFLKEYASHKTAANHLNIKPALIRECCKGNIKISAGYQWRFKKDPLFKKGICDIGPVEYDISPVARAVLQFDLNGNFTREYQSTVEAVKFTGARHSNISKCVSYAGNLSAGGFQWRYKDDPIFKDGIKNIGPASMLDYSHYKGILKFDLNGNFIKEFASVRKAARDIGKRHTLISRCAHGEAETAYGFLWKFRSDPLFANGITNIEPVHKPEKPEPKRILQFTLSGKFIKEFRSPEHAAREYGVTPTVIKNSLKEKSRMSAGFLWRYKDDPLFKNGKINVKPSPRSVINTRKNILQFDRKGTFIREYESPGHACGRLGINLGTLYNCLCGKTKTCGGYQWRYTDDPAFKNGITDLEEVKPKRFRNAKIIVQCDLEGNIIKEYHSIGEASRQLGIDRRNITLCANGKEKTAAGFTWKWKQE